MNAVQAGRVLAVVEDAAGAAAVLDAGCVLAQLLRRELELVFVENAAALAAAELSVTQVLTQGGLAWSPLAAADVERGWRAQAARLRELARRASAPRAVPWRLRVTRGSPGETARALLAGPEADLLLLAAASKAALRRSPPAPRPRVIVLDDGSPAGRQALAIARRLAEALSARLQIACTEDAALVGAAELLVLPGALFAPPVLAALRTPALLVGVPRARST